ncbi:GcvT family protein [Halostella pelagica]|uniref:GcvT family protein n=1 Tax=Halostella pelagica TaxID=2583824 RepID=UPI0010815C97|nr:FAD-dependent oxidoreductase [Halostella pelagica]
MNEQSELPDRAETLIVGAGVVGCSTAYHLAKKGSSDVVVVDKGPIPKTGGSTVHAPAGLTQTSPDRTLATIAKETREIYDAAGGWEENGAIEIATTDECWEYLNRRMDQARTNDIDGAELLTPDQVKEHVPIIETEDLIGGFHVPTDGRIDTVSLLDGLKTDAENRGVSFHERTTVTDIETTDGAVETVVTDRGRVRVDDILVAGNIWAPLIGEMVDVPIPLVPCAHQYGVTDSIEALDGWEHDVEQPWVRHWDGDLYFRQHGDGYGIGNYNHDPIIVGSSDIPSLDDAIETEPVYDFVPNQGSRHDPFKQPSSRSFTESDFEDAWREATRLFPDFEGKEIVKGFNGMFSFTPDHMPIMGESPDVDGFWVAAAIWLTHGGGAGRVMADLLEDGETDLDIDDMHITRFGSHAESPSFVHDRAYEVYDTVYDIHHPRGSFQTHRNLRQSPVYRHQKELGAEFYEDAGWERPRWYGANDSLLDDYAVPSRSGWEAKNWSRIEGAEHQAVRDRVGIADRTSETTVTITGEDALPFLQWVFTNDMDLKVGGVAETTMLNERGGVVGYGTVSRVEPDRFRVSFDGGAAGMCQVNRLRKRAPDDSSVTVSDDVSGSCVIGIYGPNARATLESVMHADLSTFGRSTARDTHVKSVPVTAVRDSDTGEDGWELHAPTEYGGNLWNTLWQAGQDHGIVAVGDGALNTLRLEAGQRAYGTDVHAEFTPFQAGLDDLVDFDTEFVGRAALRPTGETDSSVELTCLTLDDRSAVVMDGVPVFDGTRRVGHVTSAGYGYDIDACIAYAYLQPEHTAAGTSVTVEYQNERFDATVRNEPLVNRT